MGAALLTLKVKYLEKCRILQCFCGVPMPPFERAFASRVLCHVSWRDTTSPRPHPVQVTMHISTLKAMTSPAVNRPIPCFQNLFDHRTFLKLALLILHISGFWGHPLRTPNLPVFVWGLLPRRTNLPSFLVNMMTDSFSVEHKIFYVFPIDGRVLYLTKFVIFSSVVP